jgi:hypothetical protein
MCRYEIVIVYHNLGLVLELMPSRHVLVFINKKLPTIEIFSFVSFNLARL